MDKKLIKLHKTVCKLKIVLENPEEGCFSWGIVVCELWKEISELYYGGKK